MNPDITKIFWTGKRTYVILTLWLASVFCSASPVFDETGLVVPSEIKMPYADPASVMEGVKLPLMRHDNGRIKIYLTAQKAWQIEGDGVAVKDGVVVVLLTADGEIDWRFTAIEGFYKKQDGYGICFGDVSAIHESGDKDAVIYGKDVYVVFSGGKTDFVATMRNVDVTLKTGGKGIISSYENYEK